MPHAKDYSGQRFGRGGLDLCIGILCSAPWDKGPRREFSVAPAQCFR